MDDIQESLIEVFREESLELLAELETALLELENSPGDEELVNRAFRALHTVKGNAAMFGFEEIEVFTHDLESVFDQVRKGHRKVNRELIDLTLRSRDIILTMLQDPGDDSIRQEREELAVLF